MTANALRAVSALSRHVSLESVNAG